MAGEDEGEAVARGSVALQLLKMRNEPPAQAAATMDRRRWAIGACVLAVAGVDAAITLFYLGLHVADRLTWEVGVGRGVFTIASFAFIFALLRLGDRLMTPISTVERVDVARAEARARSSKGDEGVAQVLEGAKGLVEASAALVTAVKEALPTSSK